MATLPPQPRSGPGHPQPHGVHSRLSGTGRIALHPGSPYAEPPRPSRLGAKKPSAGLGGTSRRLVRSASQPQGWQLETGVEKPEWQQGWRTEGPWRPGCSWRSSPGDQAGGGSEAAEASEESWCLAPYLTDSAEQSAAGLGAIQPSGTARLLLQWSRPEPAPPKSPERLRRGCKETRRPMHPGAARPPLRLWTARFKDIPAPRLEWSGLSEASRSAIKRWVSGQIGGRHCLMQLEHDEAISLLISPLDPSGTAMADLKGGVLLNALSGLPEDAQGSWLYSEVFSKSPVRVFDDGFEAAADDVSVHTAERPSDLSAEEVNLALRHQAVQAQHAGMRSMAASSPSNGGPRCSEEFMRVQVWLELARLQADGELEEGPETTLPRQGPGSKEKDPKASRRPSDSSDAEQSWDDRYVRGQLGKPESELTAEASSMSLDTLRLQNVSIESYLMRLVRQREKLKHIARLAEECDSYVVLGLEGPDVSEAEVKKAYRNLARKEHPDKAGMDNKERFQEIQQAYTSLLMHRQSSTALEDQGHDSKEGCADSRPQPTRQLGAPAESAVQSADKARDAVAAVTAAAHLTLRLCRRLADARASQQRRPGLRQMLSLTKQGAIRLRSCAGHLCLICESCACISHSARKALGEYGDWAETATAGAGLKQRAAIATEAGESCKSTAEYLDKISDSDEAMVRKMERAVGEKEAAREEAALAQGVRMLNEGLVRTAAVVRCAADEAIASVATALELTCSLVALDRAHSQEQARAAAADASSRPAQAATNAADGNLGVVASATSRTAGARSDADRSARGSDGKDDGSRPSSRKSERSDAGSSDAGKHPADVRTRQASLRVRNILCLESLNEEVLGLQKSLRERLQQRRDKSLLPAVEPAQKDGVFDLVAQLLQSAIAEAGRMAMASALPPQQVFEQAFPFIMALEHANEVAVPADVKTQTLKLAALLDVDLLCQIFDGPFRQRLLSVHSRRRAGGGGGGGSSSLPPGRRNSWHARPSDGRRSNDGEEGWAEAVHDFCARSVLGLRRSCGVEAP
uniref:J domain-containing protein n=1 Tax=Alexandrium monilatum TaxID=311494 RepID=A0A7S4R7X5_9DINO